MRRVDRTLLVCALALLGFGLVMVYSASALRAAEVYGDPAYYLKRELVWAALGICAMVAVARMRYERLAWLAGPALAVSLVLLVLVLVPGVGKVAGGARRWLAFGPMRLQPTEMAKVALLAFVAKALHRRQEEVGSFADFFVPVMVISGLTCGLMLLEPDLGSPVLLMGAVLAVLFIGGCRLPHLLLVLVSAAPAAFFLVLSTDYRRERLLAFLDPWKYAQDEGYQVTQSLIALGAGGPLGVGLGRGMQKLWFLPAAHTDFILSVIGEELGLLGTMAVVTLFAILVVRGFRAGSRAPNPFGQYLAYGLSTLLGLQAVMNVAVVTSSMPTKGIPLPFVSYGGSSLLFTMVSVGALLNISRHGISWSAEPMPRGFATLGEKLRRRRALLPLLRRVWAR